MSFARAIEIMKLASPFEFGNNQDSVIGRRTPLGYDIISSGNISSYNVALETGPLKWKPTAKEQGNIGWFHTLGTGNIARYFYATYNYKISSDTADYKKMVERSKVTPARNQRFLNDISRWCYDIYRCNTKVF